MENGMITIAKYDYDLLLKKAERIETVARAMDGIKYLSVKDIAALLGIEAKGCEDIG